MSKVGIDACELDSGADGGGALIGADATSGGRGGTLEDIAKVIGVLGARSFESGGIDVGDIVGDDLDALGEGFEGTDSAIEGADE